MENRDQRQCNEREALRGGVDFDSRSAFSKNGMVFKRFVCAMYIYLKTHHVFFKLFFRTISIKPTLYVKTQISQLSVTVLPRQLELLDDVNCFSGPEKSPACVVDIFWFPRPTRVFR